MRVHFCGIQASGGVLCCCTKRIRINRLWESDYLWMSLERNKIFKAGDTIGWGFYSFFFFFSLFFFFSIHRLDKRESKKKK